eukprot:791114-Heterocapsa_arctica.AAC.1
MLGTHGTPPLAQLGPLPSSQPPPAAPPAGGAVLLVLAPARLFACPASSSSARCVVRAPCLLGVSL